MINRLIPRFPAALAALLALAACDSPYDIDDVPFYPGEYDYAAWSDFDSRDPAWWGYLSLDVDRDGTIYGSYELPDQCEDSRGFLIDCRGRVDGQVYRDGSIRFWFDEGWISNRGTVQRDSDVFGDWEASLPGYRDDGEFELIPY